MRPSRDATFLHIAHALAARGTCVRAEVGAVIVREGRIISSGYVGAPPGQPHCIDPHVGCLIGPDGGCIRTIHAEANSIAHAARAGTSTRDSEMFCTHAMCATCAKLLGSAGVVRVVYAKEYRDMSGIQLLQEMGIDVQYGAS